MGEKLKLYGFNNLTKALSFNIYDVCYAKTPREQRDYISYNDEQYNSERLTNILTTLTDMIGAKVLNIARQDYDPQGASVTILIAEGSMIPVGQTQLAHLDKSHVTVHTYPEYHPETCLATSFYFGLPHQLLRFRYYHHGLPGARFHPRHQRSKAVSGSPGHLHPGLHRPCHPAQV